MSLGLDCSNTVHFHVSNVNEKPLEKEFYAQATYLSHFLDMKDEFKISKMSYAKQAAWDNPVSPPPVFIFDLGSRDTGACVIGFTQSGCPFTMVSKIELDKINKTPQQYVNSLIACYKDMKTFPNNDVIFDITAWGRPGADISDYDKEVIGLLLKLSAEDSRVTVNILSQQYEACLSSVSLDDVTEFSDPSNDQLKQINDHNQVQYEGGQRSCQSYHGMPTQNKSFGALNIEKFVDEATSLTTSVIPKGVEIIKKDLIQLADGHTNKFIGVQGLFAIGLETVDVLEGLGLAVDKTIEEVDSINRDQKKKWGSGQILRSLDDVLSVLSKVIIKLDTEAKAAIPTLLNNPEVRQLVFKAEDQKGETLLGANNFQEEAAKLMNFVRRFKKEMEDTEKLSKKAATDLEKYKKATKTFESKEASETSQLTATEEEMTRENIPVVKDVQLDKLTADHHELSTKFKASKEIYQTYFKELGNLCGSTPTIAAMMMLQAHKEKFGSEETFVRSLRNEIPVFDRDGKQIGNAKVSGTLGAAVAYKRNFYKLIEKAQVIFARSAYRGTSG